MSKMKQIAALTAMLVGVIMYASPAKSAVCFLPDDDGSCGGGDIEISDGSDSDGNKKEEKCEGFPVSATEYEKMKNCFDFTSCTKSKTKEVKYKKGAQKENTTWSNGICCTNGEKYFSKQGQCCPTTGCACSGGRVWNPSTEQCECPEGKEFVGGVCTCAGNTVPDSDGNCILPAGCTYEYRQATTADSCGLTDLNTNYQCASTINGCNCYNQLQKVSSVWVYMTGHVFPYNRISNTSATCVDENNVTRYQTICQGTPKSKCDTSAGYEFKPNGCVSDTYNNGFEVKGDEWGDCLETKCNYKYVRLTASDTGTSEIDRQRLRCGKDGETCTKEGSTCERTAYCANCSNGTCKCGNSDQTCSSPGSTCKYKETCRKWYDCEWGTKCWYAINKNPSVDRQGTGTPTIGAIYNKISNKSASCVANGVRKYETLCEGTPKSNCFRFSNDNKFTPNGCVSDAYNNGFEVKGDEWGTCGCDESKGAYATIEECRSGTNSSCGKGSGGCYKTCKSQGYYSTKKECENTTYKVTCTKTSDTDDCYKREMKGFLIKYDEDYKRIAICGHAGYRAEAEAYLETVSSDSNGNEYAGPYPETVDGKAYQELPEDNSKGYQYPAGTYYLCYRQSCTVAGSSTEQSCPHFDLKALRLLRTTDYNAEFTDEVCFTGSGGGYVDKSVTCVNGYDAPNNRHPCKKVTFKAGKTYKVRFIISSAYDSSCSYQ